jgi:hypothetical protein
MDAARSMSNNSSVAVSAATARQQLETHESFPQVPPERASDAHLLPSIMKKGDTATTQPTTQPTTLPEVEVLRRIASTPSQGRIPVPGRAKLRTIRPKKARKSSSSAEGSPRRREEGGMPRKQVRPIRVIRPATMREMFARLSLRAPPSQIWQTSSVSKVIGPSSPGDQNYVIVRPMWIIQVRWLGRAAPSCFLGGP